jgi:hypothetical protein
MKRQPASIRSRSVTGRAEVVLKGLRRLSRAPPVHDQELGRIIVLSQGKIIEEGSHQSLLNQGGHYAELYNTYFRHQSLEYIEQARHLLAQ